MFIEKIIEKLSEEKTKHLSKKLCIEAGRLDILKKKLLHTLTSEAFLSKNAQDYIDDYRDLMRAMFKSGGKGEYPQAFKPLVDELACRGLLFFINKEHSQILIPFEYYFVSGFFQPSYFSLLYAFQNYNEKILRIISQYYNLDGSNGIKLTLARKLYSFIIKYINLIKENFTEEEKKTLEILYYNRGKEFWDKTFKDLIPVSEIKDKFYVKELFFKAKKDSPIFSLLLKSILIPVSDRTRIFVEELTVPSEFEQILFQEFREKENKIICDLQELYVKKTDLVPKGVVKEFKYDLKRMLGFIAGMKMKATTTKKIYYKDLKRVVDNFEWEQNYFDLLWDFIKTKKMLETYPENRIFKISDKGLKILFSNNKEIVKILYDYFLTHECCSEEIKKIVLKDLVDSYPCYVDIRYFIELSKKVASELSQLIIKEDLSLNETFYQIYYLLYNLGFAKRINVHREHYSISILALTHEGYLLASGKDDELDEGEMEIDLEFNGNTVRLPVTTDFKIINILLRVGDLIGVSEDFVFALKSEKIKEFLSEIKDLNIGEFQALIDDLNSENLKKSFGSEEIEKVN